MKNLTLLVQLFVVTFFIQSCSGSTEDNISELPSDNSSQEVELPKPNRSEDIEATKFKELVETGNGVLIDVRTPEEYSAGHIAGSINIDFNGDDFKSRIDSLDKLTPVFVYCQAGGRSGKAKDLMTEKGFSEVYNLIGGYSNYPYKD